MRCRILWLTTSKSTALNTNGWRTSFIPNDAKSNNTDCLMTSFSIYPKKRELAGSFSLGDVKTEIDPFRSLKDS